MIEIKGKYTTAKIFTDVVEEEALAQVYDICNHPAFKGSKLRYMPDIHCGSNVCIGFTSELTNFVNPSHVGGDIGCQMTSIFYNKAVDKETYPLLEHRIRKAIPTGFDINEKRIFDMKEFVKYMNSKMSSARASWPEMVENIKVDEKYITKMLQRIGMDEGVFYKSIGSIGGGKMIATVYVNSI